MNRVGVTVRVETATQLAQLRALKCEHGRYFLQAGECEAADSLPLKRSGKGKRVGSVVLSLPI